MVAKSNQKEMIKSLKAEIADLKRKEKAARKDLRMVMRKVEKAVRAGEKKAAKKAKEAKAKIARVKAALVKKYAKKMKAKTGKRKRRKSRKSMMS